MPDGGMDLKQYKKEKAKRGTLTVESDYSGISYEIVLQDVNSSEETESLGYKVKYA